MTIGLSSAFDEGWSCGIIIDMEQTNNESESRGTSRRAFLRRAAVVSATAYVVPAVQVVTMTGLTAARASHPGHEHEEKSDTLKVEAPNGTSVTLDPAQAGPPPGTGVIRIEPGAPLNGQGIVDLPVVDQGSSGSGSVGGAGTADAGGVVADPVPAGPLNAGKL